MKKIYMIIFASLWFAMLSGCNLWEEKVGLINFYSCKPKTPVGVSRMEVQMPKSGQSFIVDKKPFLSSADLRGAAVAEVTHHSGTIVTGIQFYCTIKGMSKLRTETASNRNGWIVMTDNQNPAGWRPIEGAIINDGVLFVITEYDDEVDLHEKVKQINKDLMAIEEALKKKEASAW